MAHGFQSALSGSRFNQAPGFAGGCVTLNHFFCCDTLVEMKCGESTIQSYVFPLYVYPPQEGKGLFHAKREVREPNIKPDIFKSLFKTYREEVIPEEIFCYIYAVFYSEIYRVKYAEFLKIDFPKVPFTMDYKLFRNMSEYGNRLVDLHLLKSAELDSPIARFQGKGDNKVEKVKYWKGKVYINNEQYFEGISPEVWHYQIGGYQVCDKWLKGRKGQRLSLDDIKHYCKVVTALGKTIEIQKEIDNLYPEIEKEIIEFRFKDE